MMQSPKENSTPRGAPEPSPKARSRSFSYVRPIVENTAPLLFILAIWEGVARLQIIHPALFPTITEIFGKMWELTIEGVFLKDVAHSIARLLFSVFFAIIFGTLCGLLMGTNRWVERIIVPPLNFFLAIPGIAIFPIVILWFGLTETTIIFTLAFEASLSIMLNTWGGVKSVDISLINAGRAMGATQHRLFYKVLLPASLPSIITGYRQGFSRAWRILVAGEMLASIGTGIGFRIFEARAFLASDVMYAGVIIIGILGFLLERVALRSLEIFTVQRWGMLRRL